MRGASPLLLCVVTTFPHISKPDQHVSVLENRRAMRRRKEVAQGSEFPSWRTFARMCRRMPGGCGGKMARKARQRLKAVRAQQNKSVNLASPPPSPPSHTAKREFDLIPVESFARPPETQATPHEVSTAARHALLSATPAALSSRKAVAIVGTGPNTRFDDLLA